MNNNGVIMNDGVGMVCKQCGAPLQANEKFVGEDGFTYIKCKFCKHVMPSRQASYTPEAMAFFAQGKVAYDKQNFEDAIEAFNNAIKKSGNYYEAYWFRLLAENGIEYVEDIDGKLKPTCHRCNETSILLQRDFAMAVKYAPKTVADSYQHNAAEYDAIRQRILALSRRGESYDIFISFKKTEVDASGNENGAGTVSEDNTTASAVYWELTKLGYKVFYSEESLKGVAGSDFEATIFRALDTAKVFILIGSRSEYVNATWVKNEWKRYMRMMAAGKKSQSSFIYIFNNQIPKNLDPLVIRNRQGIKFNDKDFRENLFGAIKRELGETRKNANSQPTVVAPKPAPQPTYTSTPPTPTVAKPAQAVQYSASASENLVRSTTQKYRRKRRLRRIFALAMIVLVLAGAGVGVYYAVGAFSGSDKGNVTIPPSGDGTYHIATAEDLKLIADHSEASFVLDADIDMGGATIPGYTLSGSFDGKSHTISNFTISSEGESAAGFFSGITGAVKNLVLKDVTVDIKSDEYGEAYGILVGGNSGVVTNCAVINATANCDTTFGGLVGRNYGTIDGCFVEDVEIESFASGISPTYGGLVAINEKNISNCYVNNVSIYAAHYAAGTICVGGLVGRNAGPLDNSYGIIGDMKTNNELGKNYVGIICGCSYKSSGPVTNCWYICDQDLPESHNGLGSFPEMELDECYSFEEISEGYSDMDAALSATVYSAAWISSNLKWDVGKWYFPGDDFPKPVWSVNVTRAEEV